MLHPFRQSIQNTNFSTKKIMFALHTQIIKSNCSVCFKTCILLSIIKKYVNININPYHTKKQVYKSIIIIIFIKKQEHEFKTPVTGHPAGFLDPEYPPHLSNVAQEWLEEWSSVPGLVWQGSLEYQVME